MTQLASFGKMESIEMEGRQLHAAISCPRRRTMKQTINATIEDMVGSNGWLKRQKEQHPGFQRLVG
jgi:hypothetical protein